MPERCGNDPGRECQNSTRLALLEKRVDDLEDGQGREETFRRAYYKERDERNRREAHLDAKINGIDEKLDKLVSWREVQDNKPGRLLDKLKESAIWLVLAAVLGMVLGRLGL